MQQQPLTRADLQGIRRRCEAAFEEPVAAVRLGQDIVGLVYSSDAARGSKAMPLAKYYGLHKIANAKFAAQAKQDIRRLLEEIERLRSLLGTMNDPLPAGTEPAPHGS